MLTLKQKQKQEKAYANSRISLILADYLEELSVLYNQKYISIDDFENLKNIVLNCKIRNSYSYVFIPYYLNAWNVCFKFGIIDILSYCKGIKSILEYDESNMPILLSNDLSIKDSIIKLYEIGCQIIEKQISKKKIILVIKKYPYIITLINHKRFFMNYWEKSVEVTDINGNKYNYSILDIYNLFKKTPKIKKNKKHGRLQH